LKNGRLIGKCAIITGAATGIGRATALSFGDEGAKVAIIDLDRPGGEKTALLLAEKGVSAKAFVADVTTRPDVEKVFAECIDFLKGLDILVNCVGGWSGYQRLEDMTEENWDRMIDLNLKSVYLCCHEAIPLMKGRGWGRIINLGSLAGRSTSAGTSPAHYGAAKAAVSVLTQYIAKEVGPYRITANTVAPGTTMTERAKKGLTPEKKEMFTRACPLGHLAEPEEISDVITFLASDASRYITGATIDVNGGRLMLT
jgi:NAD(P)-dependent dehydrogenase (short-subunit alcohol dehydrogenase family)